MPQSLETFGTWTSPHDLEFLEDLSIGCREIVEVGSFCGLTALTLALNGAVVHCIDTWKGADDQLKPLYDLVGDEVFRAFCHNAGGLLFEKIRPWVGTSEFYASVWPRQVDLVFIDAAHDYESVKTDIAVWAPHVKPGGILCGHDYGVDFLPGVKEAVDEINPDGVTGTVWWKRL